MKLLVSDVDGTLYRDGRIQASDLLAIRRAVELGCELCLASGRMYPELLEISNQLGLRCHFISQNGSFVHTKANTLIHSAGFPANLARFLLNRVDAQNFPYVVSCSDNRMYVPVRYTAWTIWDRMLMPVDRFEHEDELFAAGNVPCKIALFGSAADLRAFQIMIDDCSTDVTSYMADKDCLDLMPRHVSKGEALRVLLAHLAIANEEVMCIGDAHNDISMFNVTPHSFAMEHSHPEVKNSARSVVQSVAEAVDQLVTHSM
ncbi:Cof-type HAD-IIB family hydrolase [Alicyclobacillus acidiphilus]|uniref:Cof-type HAD-IIB family hydrolase n=1 Tax=Alicyclobacillus acidiphilus TaxID=182455 RepID=UPI00082B050A|nr:Cof-type HAD-IIB family hydrolase [Alicyclobacillus acidiphilus]